MQKHHISIAIPPNILEDCTDLRTKTHKLGQIARAAAIFRVEEIIIYNTDKITKSKYSNDVRIIKKILEYLDCPQYLRRLIFPKSNLLKYVGILPPLRTPHHSLIKERAKIKSHSFREGLVLASNKFTSEVEVGLEKPITIDIPNLRLNSRITLKLIKKNNEIFGFPIKKTEISDYWGYNIKYIQGSIQIIRERFSNYLLIATSRKGNSLKSQIGNLIEKLKEKDNILVIFGSPNLGLFEIFEKETLNLVDWVDFIINFLPEQGTHSIRVEEAIISSLSILNYLMY